MRPIDADALLDRAICTRNYFEIKSLIERMPTIDPPPNDPLTLEELREMDGEPVWNDTVKKYALVDAGWWDGIGRTINSHGKYRLLDDRYYRRKPEKGPE